MSVAIETLDGLMRRVTLTLDPAAIEAEVNKRLVKVAKSVRMDGFRPGKAPMSAVAQRHGPELRSEVFGTALQEGFFDAVQAAEVRVAGYPDFAPAEGGDGHTFTATFETFPTIVSGDVSQIKVTRPQVTLSDADVDRTIEVLRKQRLSYQTAERAAQGGDRVHVDYHGTIDGEPFTGGEAKDFPVVLGEGRTLADFENALLGVSAGESKTFDVAFPADYFAQELAGKTATFTATVKSVHAPHLPELDAAFAETLGVSDGIEKLRAEIGANLGREIERRIHARVKEQVMTGLLAVTPFEVPTALVDEECQEMLKKAREDMKQRGMREQDISLTPEHFAAQARRRVSLGLLLVEIAKQNDITADADRVRAKVDDFAKSYEDPAEVVAWYYADASRLAEVEALALEDTLVDWILGRAQVTDEAQTAEQLMGAN
ncbi:MAG: trigger factor [Betaproteobacteria bacterium]|nr:MAG: trigger factor [Betaproteobacteria bacterium]